MRTDQFNVVLIAAVASWVTAQLLKTLIYYLKTKKFHTERIWGAGGMPSSHSALVSSMAIMTCRVCGISSPEFALAMTLALVVMYDACGVRRAAGQHAREINRLRKIVDKLDDEIVEKINDDIDSDDEESVTEDGIKDLKELLGHTPLQVMCGALLGILIGMGLPIVIVS